MNGTNYRSMMMSLIKLRNWLCRKTPEVIAPEDNNDVQNENATVNNLGMIEEVPEPPHDGAHDAMAAN